MLKDEYSVGICFSSGCGSSVTKRYWAKEYIFSSKSFFGGSSKQTNHGCPALQQCFSVACDRIYIKSL